MLLFATIVVEGLVEGVDHFGIFAQDLIVDGHQGGEERFAAFLGCPETQQPEEVGGGVCVKGKADPSLVAAHAGVRFDVASCVSYVTKEVPLRILFDGPPHALTDRIEHQPGILGGQTIEVQSAQDDQPRPIFDLILDFMNQGHETR